ncbi:hypothetical protein G7Y89_g9766 [Cudoniella acicularis]|uniref:DUF7730 domain-containing protein n=1 Tax=Cudoniella acicularis TaxID=354080 RepID=A0A8H4RHQ6_9HELO|nr:hypothetical protein G7Y89_g9766 [Cudoniella acicularis]
MRRFNEVKESISGLALTQRVLVITLYYPVYLYQKLSNARQHRKDDKHHDYTRTEPEPRSVSETKILGRHRQGLNFPPSSFKNSESVLLSLPREIRDIIFEYVAGGMVIHFWIKERKLNGHRSVATKDLFRADLGLSSPSKICWISPTIGVMGMLLSCRQVYSEAISHLYAKNLFGTTECDVVTLLPQLLDPTSFNNIRSFSFYWSLRLPTRFPPLHGHYAYPVRDGQTSKDENGYIKTWLRVWKSLSSMQGLEALDVQLDFYPQFHPFWYTVMDLEIVKSVTIPKRFIIISSPELVDRMRGELEAENLQIMTILEAEKGRPLFSGLRQIE